MFCLYYIYIYCIHSKLKVFIFPDSMFLSLITETVHSSCLCLLQPFGQILDPFVAHESKRLPIPVLDADIRLLGKICLTVDLSQFLNSNRPYLMHRILLVL